VVKGSIAEAAGVRDGDLLAEIAGVAPRQVGEVVEIVQRQAPGTWLPLKVRRGDNTLELIAKFPPRAP
jgi:S1-C subfamily serine protease